MPPEIITAIADAIPELTQALVFALVIWALFGFPTPKQKDK